MASNSSPQAIKNNIMIKGIDEQQKHAIEKLFREQKWSLDMEVMDNIEDSSNEFENYFIPPCDGKSKCPFCFCQPCITNIENRQAWWSLNNGYPSAENSRKRKDCYKRFWAMMFHRGVWNIPEYTIKKDTILAGKTNETVIIMREIMPDCVLKIVRGWFPNPPGTPYMGHKWN